MTPIRRAISIEELPAPPDGKQGWPWTVAPSAETALGVDPPRCTVVTPSYNQAEFLEETIRSVLLQDYPELEYIIIDGGSTDGSAELIAKYEPWLSYWVSESDAGQADAINKGFSRATGNVVAWLNSDDYYCPHAVSRAMGVMGGRQPPICVYGDCYVVGKDGELVANRLSPVFCKDRLYVQDYITQPATFFDYECARRIGFLDVSLQWTLDWDLWLRLAQEGPLSHMDDTLACARVYAENKTLSGGEKRNAEILRLFRKHTVRRPIVIVYWLVGLAYRLDRKLVGWPRVRSALFGKPARFWVRAARTLRGAAGARPLRRMTVGEPPKTPPAQGL